jgi:hypothetical protein
MRQRALSESRERQRTWKAVSEPNEAASFKVRHPAKQNIGADDWALKSVDEPSEAVSLEVRLRVQQCSVP